MFHLMKRSFIDDNRRSSRLSNVSAPRARRTWPLDNDRRPGYVRIFHGRLERYPTDKIIKLMDRGFAPVAIALSFVAGNGDRSGDERFNCIGAGAAAPTFPSP
jgi:hypothetical protein